MKAVLNVNWKQPVWAEKDCALSWFQTCLYRFDYFYLQSLLARIIPAPSFALNRHDTLRSLAGFVWCFHSSLHFPAICPLCYALHPTVRWAQLITGRELQRVNLTDWQASVMVGLDMLDTGGGSNSLTKFFPAAVSSKPIKSQALQPLE